MEQWAKIKGTHYSVSSGGRVRNDETGKNLSLQTDRYGYSNVHLYFDGKEHRIQVHRLVAQAFLPNPLNMPQVNHIDGNKQNNNMINLEWVTNAENQKHAIKHGLIKSARPVICVETNEHFSSIGEAERETGIPNSCISDCLRGICKYAHGYHFVYA